tara:strand:+ start:4288 stop:4788 length:501 start_codon:yes stop_codon:yes gene_type:complete
MPTSDFDATDGHPIFAESLAPQFGADLTQVGEYAATVGTRIVGSTAERDAWDSAGWSRPGLRWYDTTTNRESLRVSGGWVLLGGVVTANTDTSGLVTVAHSLGFEPAGVQLTYGPANGLSGPNTILFDIRLWDKSSTQFRARFRRWDTDDWIDDAQNVRFTWSFVI